MNSTRACGLRRCRTRLWGGGVLDRRNVSRCDRVNCAGDPPMGSCVDRQRAGSVPYVWTHRRVRRRRHRVRLRREVRQQVSDLLPDLCEVDRTKRDARRSRAVVARGRPRRSIGGASGHSLRAHQRERDRRVHGGSRAATNCVHGCTLTSRRTGDPQCLTDGRVRPTTARGRSASRGCGEPHPIRLGQAGVEQHQPGGGHA